MVDRTREDIIQDTRIGNLEQLERELKTLLDNRLQRIQTLEAQIKPVAEFEQRLAWMGNQVDNFRKALAPVMDIKSAFVALHDRVNAIDDFIAKVKHKLGF